MNAQLFQNLTTKMTAQLARVGTKLPFIAQDGVYREMNTPDGISFWTNGFWPGILWQMYNATGDEAYRTTAQQIENRLDEALHMFEKLHHDTGFMYTLSAVADFRLTGCANSRRRGLHAANLLAGRFNTAGRFIRAWNDGTRDDTDIRGYMIIDSLMNLPLLFWASEETDDPRFKQIAIAHADTSLLHILRPDGSCNHIARFDPDTGAFIEAVAGQGYAQNSAWSRGIGWALYGYALCYRYTQDEKYLAASKQCAHYAIAALSCNHFVPLLDFRAPAEPVRTDTSAGMIIACGLLELADHVQPLECPLYEQSARRLFDVCETQFANWKMDEDSILNGAGLQYHNDRLADVPVIYGDYFFVEAALRLLGKAMPIW